MGQLSYAHVIDGVVIGVYLFSRPVEVAEYVTIEDGIVVELGDRYDGDQFTKPPQAEASVLIPVDITGVEGALRTSRNFATITMSASQPVVVRGTLAVPDQVFLMPLRKINADSGQSQVLYSAVDIKDGAFELSLSLASGKYEIDQPLLNAEFEVPMFSIPKVQIYVVV